MRMQRGEGQQTSHPQTIRLATYPEQLPPCWVETGHSTADTLQAETRPKQEQTCCGITSSFLYTNKLQCPCLSILQTHSPIFTETFKMMGP